MPTALGEKARARPGGGQDLLVATTADRLADISYTVNGTQDGSMSRDTMGKPRRPLERLTLSVQVYRALRNDIVLQKLAPSERLVQDELASQFGTSRIPVRDALIRLEGEGLIRSGEHGAYFVAEIDIEEVQELFDLRAIVEPYAALRALPRHSSHQIAEIVKLHRKAGKAVESGDAEAYLDYNTAFHSMLYQGLSDRTLRIIQSLWAGIPLLTPLAVPQQMEHSQMEHHLIVGALEQRDARALKESIRSHIVNSQRRLEEFYQKR